MIRLVELSILVFFISFQQFCFSQTKENYLKEKNLKSKYKTEHVIIVVIDGSRFSESWGDISKKNIPFQSKILAKNGVLYSNFYNQGPTYTNAGHSAITTGYYQEINNLGYELPKNPSIFQQYISQKKLDKTNAWIIASKHKLDILANTNNPEWKNKYTPSYDCGKTKKFLFFKRKVYQEDSITFKKAIRVLETNHPRLMLINFKEPDDSGHANNWESYLKGIRDTDEYVYKLWEYIENSPKYKGKTTLFITNDHGRHLDGINNGFVSHGDNCEGCKHISLLTIGPDFKKNKIIETKREQIDIPSTIAELLQFNFLGFGKVMTELFE